MGIFICMRPPTAGMIDAANHSGTYRHPANGQIFPKVQILSVEQLLAGQRPKMPMALLPYFQARKRTDLHEPDALF